MNYMLLDAGLPKPDLVISLITPFSDVLSRGGVAPSLFIDTDFQQRLRSCYADPRIWKGINVMVHETQSNRWASRKLLIRRIQGEPLLRSDLKQWSYLWDQTDSCWACKLDLSPCQSVFRCFSCNSPSAFWLFDGKLCCSEDTGLSGLCFRIRGTSRKPASGTAFSGTAGNLWKR